MSSTSTADVRAAAPAASSPPAPGAARARSPRGETAAFYGFIAPWLVGTAVLGLFPLGYAFYLSFTGWDGITPFKPWVGLGNYAELATSAEVWSSLGRTLVLVAVVVPATIIGSLVLALMLNRKVRARAAFRALVFLPSVVPPVAATLIWRVIFDRDSGSLNRLIESFGGSPVDWLTGNHAFIALLAVMLWAIGAGIIIDLAALQTVDGELLEAAKVDGAGPLLSFRTVTLPAISPVLLFQTVLTLITVLQTFVPAILLAPGAPGVSGSLGTVPTQTQVYMVDVYLQFFQYGRYGYGSAMIVLFFLVILLITALVFKVMGRSVYYGVDPTVDRKAKR